MPSPLSPIAPPPQKTDLDALVVIADNFIEWRRSYLKKTQTWIGICVTILCLSLLPALNGVGFFQFLMFFSAIALWLILIYPAGKANAEIPDQALPVICDAIGLQYSGAAQGADKRLDRLTRTGMFPSHDLHVRYGISASPPDHPTITWDRFSTSTTYNDDGKTRRKTTFRGALLSFTAPKHLPDMLLRPYRGKISRSIAASLRGLSLSPMKHRADFTITLKCRTEFSVFYRVEHGLDAAVEQITQLLNDTWHALPTGASIQGFECNKGEIAIVTSYKTPMFQMPGVYTNKLKLVKVFGQWLESATLPLDIFSIWHGNTPNTDLED